MHHTRTLGPDIPQLERALRDVAVPVDDDPVYLPISKRLEHDLDAARG